VGCLTAGYYECVNLLEAIKQIDPNIIKVVGGHRATDMPQDFIDEFTDYIVIGEGETTLIGFESFRDADLEKWDKRNTVANNIKATKILKEFGVEIVGYFLVDPAFSEKDFQQLLEHVQKLEVDKPIFSILTPFPGTQLFDEVKDKIITRNYTFYDGMHALMPTELDPKKFYKLYADLFRKSYPKTKLIKKIIKGEISFSLSQAITQTRYLKQLTDVSTL
jgi:radical SAM superfamily enzyme YgiQ (UPF0313 family)